MSVVAAPDPAFRVPDGVRDRIATLGEDIERLAERQSALADLIGIGDRPQLNPFEIFQGYMYVGVVAFVITLLTTPLVRRLAVANGVIDRPTDPRKVHRMPIAYLGGVAIFLGLMGGIFYSYLSHRFGFLIDYHATTHKIDGLFHPIVPLWIPLGMTVIMLIGLIDDVTGISPRVKLGGQLFAAAALAYGDVGTNVAAGVLGPTIGELLNNRELIYHIPLPDLPFVGPQLTIDLIYWTGTAIIAIFVLGACNASNLIDGLDGLLTGVTSIAAIGLLVIALGLAAQDYGRLDAPRIILCLALVGACLGFLPHNFNPATIFLGDCGSLLLGYFTVVIILTLGDEGQTFLVFAGLIIYAIPIIDTVLAIVRRKLAGKRMSDADSDHLHHMLKRSLGVKGAVLTLYGIGTGFAVLGVAISTTKARFVYALALLFAAYISVYAIKIARKAHIEAEALAFDARFQTPDDDDAEPARSEKNEPDPVSPA